MSKQTWSAWDAQTDAQARVNESLSPVVRRSGVDAVQEMTPLDFVMAMDDVDTSNDDDYNAGRECGLEEGRLDGVRIALRMIFKDGYHPGLSMRRLYALALKLESGLVSDMSAADLGCMFGEGRAAFDKRMLLMFRPMGLRSRDQKRESVVRKLRVAQRGNGNRRNGKLKAKVLNDGGGS